METETGNNTIRGINIDQSAKLIASCSISKFIDIFSKLNYTNKVDVVTNPIIDVKNTSIWSTIMWIGLAICIVLLIIPIGIFIFFIVKLLIKKKETETISPETISPEIKKTI